MQSSCLLAHTGVASDHSAFWHVDLLLACLHYNSIMGVGSGIDTSQCACCAELGFQMDLLNIGCGSCSAAGSPGSVPAAVNSALAGHILASLGAQIIAEPGRWAACCFEQPMTVKTGQKIMEPISSATSFVSLALSAL